MPGATLLASQRPALVLDCGTGFSKLGFSGNLQPSYVIPTAIAINDRTTGKLDDLNFHVGEDALACASTHSINYPVRHGVIDNWDHMERFWQQCIFQYLRVEPEDHNVVLTEPPMNPPEAREYTAEVMFETFNVAGLYIGAQAVLALYASAALAENRGGPPLCQNLTGTVVDSGDGVTHVIPVVDGYVLGSSIRSTPIAGREVSLFVQQLLRDRGEPVPPEFSLDTARRIKESHGYVCANVPREFGRFDREPAKSFKKYVGVNPKTGKEFEVDVGYEQFLGPEIFFTPDIAPSAFSTSLPQLVDDVVQSCPIDTRRSLYGNVVLSGGSTMFKNFGRRMGGELMKITQARTKPGAKAVEVNVVSHQYQRYGVWFGGSTLAAAEQFPKACISREQYQECGPSVCRDNYVFRGL